MSNSRISLRWNTIYNYLTPKTKVKTRLFIISICHENDELLYCKLVKNICTSKIIWKKKKEKQNVFFTHMFAYVWTSLKITWFATNFNKKKNKAKTNKKPAVVLIKYLNMDCYAYFNNKNFTGFWN